MATRREIEKRKVKLRADLQQEIQRGALLPGSLLPPVTHLAKKYGLSITVVRQALQPLMEAGFIYTAPRIGTFVGNPLLQDAEFYLLTLAVSPAPGTQAGQIKAGFEQRIAQMGASSLVMVHEGFAAIPKEELPTLSGYFDATYPLETSGADKLPPTLPCVQFAKPHEDKQQADTVTFDDRDGGAQATRHLLQLGHRHIAFLGLHSNSETTGYLWSAERAIGWQQEMARAGVPAETLCFCPEVEKAWNKQTETARMEAKNLLLHRDITAVVACNDFAALGLFAALRANQIAPAQWPAVVSFDDNLSTAGYIVTALRLPWEEIGAAAADLLWERRHGRLTGAPICRLVPMRLIPRLTSRANWSLMAGQSVLNSLEIS